MPERESPGFELPFLLFAGFRSLIDETHRRLADQGHPDLRPAHGFAMQAVGLGGVSASELGRRLGVSKQATSKLLDAMEDGGYVRRRPDEHDGRVKVVGIEPRGRELLDAVEAVYVELEEGWAEVIGVTGLEQTRRRLERVLRSRHGAVLPSLRPT